MKEFDPEKIVTCYCFIYDDDSMKKPKLHAYTTDKVLYELYKRFHNCKRMKVKKFNDKAIRIEKLMESYYNNIIEIYQLITVEREGKYKGQVTDIGVPMTAEEKDHLNCYVQGFSLRDDDTYGFSFSIVGYLKNKYIDALEGIYFINIMEAMLREADLESGRDGQSIQIDELAVFMKVAQDTFD